MVICKPQVFSHTWKLYLLKSFELVYCLLFANPKFLGTHGNCIFSSPLFWSIVFYCSQSGTVTVQDCTTQTCDIAPRCNSYSFISMPACRRSEPGLVASQNRCSTPIRQCDRLFYSRIKNST